VEVAVEGRLARLRLGDPDRLDRARVLEARERGEVGAQPRPEPLGELLVGVAPRRPSVAMPSSSSRATVFGRCGHEAGDASAKRIRAPSAVSSRKPSGFSASDATFATSLFGPMPTLQVSPVSALTASLTRARRSGAGRAGEVEVGLVEPTTSTRSTCASAPP
jgi:hypothetical protein